MQTVDNGGAEALFAEQLDKVAAGQRMGNDGDVARHLTGGADCHGHQPIDGEQRHKQQNHAADGLSDRSDPLFPFHEISSLHPL